MSGLPDDPRELFEDGGVALENARIIGASFTGRSLTLHLSDEYAGRFSIEASVEVKSGERLIETGIKLTYDEPLGAGADPYGRPNPQTHPEFWTE